MTRYELYPLQREILRERLKYELDLRKVFRKNIDLTTVIKKDIEERLRTKNRKNWVLIQINGETGSMKSSVALAIMKQLIDHDFTAESISQEYNRFLEMLRNSNPGQGFILDEMVFQHGTGSVRLKDDIVNLAETLRKRMNSMIFVTPTEKFLKDENVTFTLEPCGFDEENKTVRCLVRKGRYLGFFYVPLLWKHPIWKDYEKGKDDFIERSSQGDYAKLQYETIARKLLSEMPEEYMKNAKRMRLYVEKNNPNLTTKEAELLLEQMKIVVEEG